MQIRRFSRLFSAILAVGLLGGSWLDTSGTLLSAAPWVQEIPPAGKTSSTPAAESAVQPWNQWRGPQRDTTFTGPQWPAKLNESNLKLVWQHKLEPSYSGPITDGQRIFTTETVAKREETTRAYDLVTGKPLWEVKWPGSMTVPFFANSNGSWIRSTPACDESRLYVVGMLDVLVCFESATGKELWRIDFAKQYETGNPPFGAVCSPLMDKDHLYLQAANSFFKIQKADGKVVWRTMNEDGGMMSGGSFSSPSFATLGEKFQILVQSRINLAGIDPESGQVLWQTEVPHFRGMNILTPIEFEDSVFTSSYNHQSFLYQVPTQFGGRSPSDNVAVAWSNPAKGYMSTPTIIDGHAYLLLQNGRLACLSLKDGERKWTSPKQFGEYASFVTQGDRFLMLSNSGLLRLIKASTEDCEVISELQLPEIDDSWAHIGMGVGAAGQIQIYIRSLKGLHVFDWSDPIGTR
jgi:outer membrane protein assembly factor BamB